MHLKPPPKLILTRNDDGLHQTLDSVADALATTPDEIKIAPVPKNQQTENQQTEKQAVLSYFASLMTGFFIQAQKWQTLPLAEAQAAYEDYLQGTIQALPPKLKTRFASRAKVYARGLFSAMADAEKAAAEAQNHQAYALLLEQLEAAVLAAVKLPEAEQTQIIGLAFSDYHHALVAGVQAGFLAKENAEFLAEDLQKQLLFAAVLQAVQQSENPIVLALQIADGQTGDPALDTLPEAERRLFLETLFEEETHEYY